MRWPVAGRLYGRTVRRMLRSAPGLLHPLALRRNERAAGRLSRLAVRSLNRWATAGRGPAGQPLGSTTIVTSGVIPESTLIATLYVPSALIGWSRSILCLSTVMPRRPRASAMSWLLIEP